MRPSKALPLLGTASLSHCACKSVKRCYLRASARMRTKGKHALLRYVHISHMRRAVPSQQILMKLGILFEVWWHNQLFKTSCLWVRGFGFPWVRKSLFHIVAYKNVLSATAPTCDDFCVTWREGLRRMWGLLPDLHSNSVSLKSTCIRVHDKICCRFPIEIT
jgi:hypothetical protein